MNRLLSRLVCIAPLALLACGEPEPEGMFVQVEPPSPEDPGNGLPFSSEREHLVDSTAANVYVQVLCRGNQGFGPYYDLDGYQCFGTRDVVYIRWDATLAAGDLIMTDNFTIDTHSHGTVDGNRIVDLPAYTDMVFTGTGSNDVDVAEIGFRFEDGPVIVDFEAR